jgi:hypothetical protein
MSKNPWNIILIVLAVIGAIAVIGWIIMGLMHGGMMSGMMGG